MMEYLVNYKKTKMSVNQIDFDNISSNYIYREGDVTLTMNSWIILLKRISNKRSDFIYLYHIAPSNQYRHPTSYYQHIY